MKRHKKHRLCIFGQAIVSILFLLLLPEVKSHAQTRMDITAVTVDADSQHINAVSTHTIQLITATVIPNGKRIRITYPVGFDVSGAAVDGATMLQSGTVSVQSAAGNVVDLRSGGGGVNPGAQSIVLSGIVNTGTPATGLAVDVISFELPMVIIDDDDLTPATFAISGIVSMEAASTPIATNNLNFKTATGGDIALTNFKLTASGEDADITELKFTPTYSIITGAVLMGLDVYRDANTNGILDGGDASISAGAQAITGSGNELTINIPNHRLTNGVPREFFIVGDFSAGLVGGSAINVNISSINALASRPTGVTSGIETGPYGPPGFTITGPLHQATPLTYTNITAVKVQTDSQHIYAMAADTIRVATVTQVPNGGFFKIRYPADFNVTGAAIDPATVTQSGIDPVIITTSVDTVILTTAAVENVGVQTIVLRGIVNTGTASAALTIDVFTADAAGEFLDHDDPTPPTFAITGTVTQAAATAPITSNNLLLKAGVGGNIALTNFKLTAAGENADIAELKFTPNYTIIDGASLTGLDVYRDVNANGKLDGGDSSITSGAANIAGSGSELTIAIPSHRLNKGTSQEFLLVGNFTSALTSGSTIRVNISAPSALTSLPVGDSSGIQIHPAGSSITGATHTALSLTDLIEPDDFVEPDTVEVTGSGGMTITIPSGGLYTRHSLEIPPNAFAGAGIRIIVRAPTTDDIPADQIRNVPSAVVFEVLSSESGYTFNDSVTVTIEYQPFEVGKNEKNMRIHVWHPIHQMWKRVLSTQTVDSINNIITANIDHLSIFGAIEVPDTTSETTLSPGWNMLSLPVDPQGSETDPNRLIADDVRPFFTEQFNSCLYIYDEPTNSWVMPKSIFNGLGFILYCFEETTMDVSGLEMTGDLIKTLTRTNNNGWHLVGNIYLITLNWDYTHDIARQEGIDDVYYRWTGKQYEFYPGGGLTNNLNPWDGIWVHTRQDSAELTIDLNRKNNKAGGYKSRDQNVDWRIQLEAFSGDNRDTHNYFGISENSSQEYDGYDAYELVPLNNEFISLYFPHQDWEDSPGNFTQDIRPPLSDSVAEWEIEVAAKSSADHVNLHWSIPENFDRTLDVSVTVPGGNRINMLDKTEYRYIVTPSPVPKKTFVPSLPFKNNPADFTLKLADNDITIRKFTITVSKKSSGEEMNMIPSDYSLNQNYPNPFNAATTIKYGIPKAGQVSLKIYNILGQEVRNLVNSHHNVGVYTAIWDAKDNRGIELASGVYFCKIITDNFSYIRKLILLR